MSLRQSVADNREIVRGLTASCHYSVTKPEERAVTQPLPMTWGKVFREILGKVSSLPRRYEDTASPLPLDVSYLDMTLQTITHLGTMRGVRLRTKPTQGRNKTKRITKKQTQSQTFCSWTFYYTKEFFSLLVKSVQVRVSVPYTPKHPTWYIIYMCHLCIRPSSHICFPYAVAP